MRFVLYNDLTSGAKDQLGVSVHGVVYPFTEAIKRAALHLGKAIPSPLPTTIYEYHIADESIKTALNILIDALLTVPVEHRSDLIRTDITWLPPVTNLNSIRCFSAFADHTRTTHQRLGHAVPATWYNDPGFFYGNRSAVFGHGAIIHQPVSFWLDYELQVACVIGKEGRNIRTEDAASYIAGYTILNDWCARDIEAHTLRLGMGPGKGRDFAISMGPELVTPDELVDYTIGKGERLRYDLTTSITINHKPIPMIGNTTVRAMHFTFAQMIAYASADVTLYPGDVLASGAVDSGSLMSIGAEETFGRWLQDGDTVDLEVEMLGVLRNTIGEPAL